MDVTLISPRQVNLLMKACSNHSAKEMTGRYHDFVTEYEGGAVDLWHCDETAPVGTLDDSIQKYCFQGMAKRFVRPASKSERAKPNKHRPAVILTGVYPNLYPAGITTGMLSGTIELLEDFGYHDIRMMAASSKNSSDPFVYWFESINQDSLDRIINDMKGFQVLRNHPDHLSMVTYSEKGNLVNFV